MGWKYRLVKEFQLVVMMYHCCIMSILLYHAGSNVMGQNPCTSHKFFFVVLFLRPSAPPFHLSYLTNGTGQDSGCKVFSRSIGWSMWVSQDSCYFNSHCCNWPAHKAWHFLRWNAVRVEQDDVHSIWWYVKNGTVTEVRTCQCKFQFITFPLRTTMHIFAYKLSDT